MLGFGVAGGFIVSGVVGEDDKPALTEQANTLGGPLTFAGEFGAPGSPQQIYQNSAYAHYDVQIHNRDNPNTWDAPLNAQHGPTCSGPPNTHGVTDLADGVFICADHVMTAANSVGYGEIVLTPSQILNCSAGCTVQWDMSTERLSSRDWPDVWLTPWADNLTLPFDVGDVDLQGPPRSGIHINLQDGQNGAFHASTLAYYVETGLPYNSVTGIGGGIVAGTNQAAVRQTFKLTVTPGHIKFERLASATATQVTWVDTACACLLAPDYVAQFAHHSYNPTKEGAGVPATWHWANFAVGPSTPFTLIHAMPLIAQQGASNNPTTITFASPAPANASLRFSGICTVLVDGVAAPKQKFTGFYEHSSSYFIPIAQGKTSVQITFAPDAWFSNGYAPGCHARDFAVWSKSGGAPLPTPTPLSSTPTPVIPVTPTPGVPPTPTPLPATQACTKLWGIVVVRDYGALTQAQCLAVTP